MTNTTIDLKKFYSRLLRCKVPANTFKDFGVVHGVGNFTNLPPQECESDRPTPSPRNRVKSTQYITSRIQVDAKSKTH